MNFNEEAEKIISDVIDLCGETMCGPEERVALFEEATQHARDALEKAFNEGVQSQDPSAAQIVMFLRRKAQTFLHIADQLEELHPPKKEEVVPIRIQLHRKLETFPPEGPFTIQDLFKNILTTQKQRRGLVRELVAQGRITAITGGKTPSSKVYVTGKKNTK